MCNYTIDLVLAEIREDEIEAYRLYNNACEREGE